MPLNPHMVDRLNSGRHSPTAPRPKYGAEIFAGTDYPQTFDGFVGQEQAVLQLRTAIYSARMRETRLDHVLLASGAHGIGKTTLAQLVAAEMGTGFVALSGPVMVDDARNVLTGMVDGDVLMWDEFHLAVAGGKQKAEWLLPYMTDRVLLTKRGPEQMPDVTLVAATTDAGKLPQTIISRFMLRPRLTYYTPEEGTLLCKNLCGRMDVAVEAEDHARIARAANNNPRDMRLILTAVRDLNMVGASCLQTAFEWAGVTADGLSAECQEIMLVLLASTNHTASQETIQASLGEPGPLRHHEQVLIQRGYLTVTGRGRMLTEEGLERAQSLLVERAL